MLPGVGV